MSAAAQQTNNPSWDKPIDSIKRVIEAIQFLKMPNPPRDSVVLLINSQEKGKFKKALEDCIGMNGREPDRETKVYLFGLVSCLSSEMSQALATLGYQNIPPEMFIHIGSNSGMAFRAAVHSALNQSDQNHEMGKDVVRNSLVDAAEILGIEYVAGNTDQAATPAPQAPRGDNVTSILRPQEVRSASSAQASDSTNEADLDLGTSSNMTGNSYLSTHAYGSKAALCFNTAMSKDQSSHTIIVDAALANDQRIYDWASAIKIQLGHKELPLLYAVLAGWRKGFKIVTREGVKSFEIERQPTNHFYVKVSDKGQVLRAVQISSQDAFPIMKVTLIQIMRQVPQELRAYPEIIIGMIKSSQCTPQIDKEEPQQ